MVCTLFFSDWDVENIEHTVGMGLYNLNKYIKNR